MLTISDIAKELNVSRGTVYNAIVKAGLSIDSLTVEKQGNKRILSADGEKTVRELFANDTGKEASKRTVNDSLTKENERLTATVKRLTDELTAEKAKLAAAEEQRLRDQQTIEQLNRTVEAQNATIQAQAVTTAAQATTIQEMQQAATQRLTAAAEKKPGRIARLIARIKGE